MLTREGCHSRQQRLLEQMARERWDVFVTSNPRTVYYLSGAFFPERPAIFAMFDDGRSLLTSPGKEAPLAEIIVPLEVYSIARDISLPMHDAAELLRNELTSASRKPVLRYAVDRERTVGLVESVLAARWPEATLCDASSQVLKLRRYKEPDELVEIRASLELCAVAYRTARAVIAPELTEIDVFNAMQAAVNSHAGTFVELKGDFACGKRGIRGGGAPTSRAIQKGDLYILDLFPVPAFYMADTCRTFCVGEPTDLQVRAWEAVREAQRMAEAAIKPGVCARDVYASVKEFLDSQDVARGSFWHHVGHAIGHDGHEPPRIIPGSEDRFDIGDVLAVEPALYSQALQGGIRLEDNYYLGREGLENLFDFPLEL